MLARHFRDRAVPNLVVAATDVGDAKRARDTARILNAPIAIAEKRRLENQDKVEAVDIIGDVSGKNVLIVDDEISTGGTLVATAQAITRHGAEEIYCSITHPVLSGKAPQLLEDSPISEFVVTDTLPIPNKKKAQQDQGTLRRVPPRRGHSPHPQRPLRRRHVRLMPHK